MDDFNLGALIFWLSMTIALFAGTANVGRISSIDSTGNQEALTYVEWSCDNPWRPNFNDETCYLNIYDDGHIEPGP